MTDRSFDELLQRAPGDGVTVDRFSDGVQIHIAARYCWTGKAIAKLVGMGCGSMIVMRILAIVLMVNFNLNQFWFSVLPLMPLVIPATIFMTRSIASQMPATVKISPDGIEIEFRNQLTSLRWDKIKSVRPVFMRKPGQQLYPDLKNPYRKGSGDGVAFETPHGEFRQISWWHDEVCVWVADLINAYAAENNIVIRRPRVTEAEPTPAEFPAKVDRKNLLKIGLVAMPIAVFFLYGAGEIAYEASTVGSWQQTQGTVIESRPGNQPSRVIDYVIRYEYEVDEDAFQSDRYSFDTSYSESIDLAMRSLAVGDQVTVTYAPEDPSRAVIETGFPWFEGILAAVSAIGFIAALITFIYSLLATDSEAAEQYDVMPQEES